jgi:hypothetical protein
VNNNLFVTSDQLLATRKSHFCPGIIVFILLLQYVTVVATFDLGRGAILRILVILQILLLKYLSVGATFN